MAEEAVGLVLKKEKIDLSGALNMACFRRHYSLVKLLLSHGANPDTANLSGSPFYNLLIFAKLDDNLLKTVQLLLYHGEKLGPSETNFRGNIVDLVRGQKSTVLNTMLCIL